MELKLSENAIKVLEKRYLDPGEKPYERYSSMAKAIADAEITVVERKEWSDAFLKLFAEQKILPNTPAIINYGKEKRQQQGSACFVLPIKDDLNDIFDTIRKAALIHKSGGGTGYNFSSLRPNGAIVKTTGKFSSGVIPFIKAYDAATGAVSQGGTRRGANMGILNVNHPDIISFIKCKSEDKQISNFNLSVGVTESFFNAVKNDEDWELYFLGEDGERIQFYPDGDEKKELVTETVVKAKELFNLIIEYSHKNGEPGVIFVDRLQDGNSVPHLVINATNPCGEQPLPPDNSCVLASISLAKHMKSDWSDLDWALLDDTICIGTRMLDDIVTQNEYPIDEIKIRHDEQRRIGLGFTSLADVLIMMGVPYGSNEGRKKAGQIMKYINNRSHYWSYMLGKEKGNFPLFKESKFNLNGKYRNEAIEFYKEFLPSSEFSRLIDSGIDGYMRNAATSTIAPTGTLTTLLDVEGYGCEPLFAIGYFRYILNGEKLPYISKIFENISKKFGFYSKKLIEKTAETGSAQLEEVPKKWREVFKTANEISVNDHILMQAELQKYCDSGISKTINMSSEATKEDVANAYWLAFETGTIKGLTVYRDKSRDGAPISVGTGEKKEEKKEVIDAVFKEKFVEIDVDPVKIERLAKIAEEIEDEEIISAVAPIKRPKVTEGSTGQYNTGCGKMYLTVNHDNRSIIETFGFTGASGGCQGLTEGLSRMVSLTIRLVRGFADTLDLDTDKVVDSAMAEIIDQLKSVRCNVALRNKKSEGKSCPDIMGKALEKEYKKLKQLKQMDKSKFENSLEKVEKEVIEKLNDIKDSCEDVGGCSACEMKSICHGEEKEETNDIVEKSVEEMAKDLIAKNPHKETFPCPQCGFPMQKAEGCSVCISCGYSKCN